MDADPLATEQTLAALGLPLGAGIPSMPARAICRHAGDLVTAATANDLWRLWNPGVAPRVEEPAFGQRFRRWLAEGLALGYSLNRFRDASSRLADSGDPANWIASFEDSVAGEDCCRVRLLLSREQYLAFKAPIRKGADDEEQSWDQMLSMMADGLFYELGLVFSAPEIAVDDALQSPWYRCEWNDLRLPPQAGLDDQHVLFNDTVDRLRLLDIKGETATNPANGNECAIIDKAHQSLARSAGLTTWDAPRYAVLALSAAIREAAAGLVNRSLYDLYMVRLRDFQPELMAALDGSVGPDFVVQVLRGLLEEEVSVRDLPAILQSILELRSVAAVDMARNIIFAPPTGGVFADARRTKTSDLMPADYVEFVRMGLKRYVSHKFTRGRNTLIVYLMDPDAEKRLARPGGVDAAEAAAILQAVRSEVGSLPPTAQSPVILTTMEIRHPLRRLIAPSMPKLHVLSYQELSPDMNIQPIARIEPDF